MALGSGTYGGLAGVRYDPVADTFVLAGPVDHPRSGGELAPAVALPNGRVLLLGGSGGKQLWYGQRPGR